jgi:hypothetical protein
MEVRMMKKLSSFTKGILVVGVSVFLGVGALNAYAQHAHKQDQHEGHKMKEDMAKEVTLVGEVLDLYCFMKHPANGQGAEHAKCAKNCIKKGLPIGFLADGKVYVIVGKEHESVGDLVLEFAGAQSKLTGTLFNHHGVMGIELASIEAVE